VRNLEQPAPVGGDISKTQIGQGSLQSALQLTIDNLGVGFGSQSAVYPLRSDDDAEPSSLRDPEIVGKGRVVSARNLSQLAAAVEALTAVVETERICSSTGPTRPFEGSARASVPVCTARTEVHAREARFFLVRTSPGTGFP
jgi:hypothetical protein